MLFYFIARETQKLIDFFVAVLLCVTAKFVWRTSHGRI